jgi:urease accessory protein
MDKTCCDARLAMKKYHSQLIIHTVAVNGKTIPSELFYSAPYKLMNYFETPSGGIEYILMNASPGVMANDHYQVTIDVGENSRLTLLPQSFEKIHKMDDGAKAFRDTVIFIDKNAYLKYIGLPAIPFADSAYCAITKIHLKDASSQLLYGDILSSGRHLSDEKFAFRHYESNVEIFMSEGLACKDHCVFTPAQDDLSQFGFFENHSYIANLFIYGFHLDESMLEKIVHLFEIKNAEVGITELLQGGYLIRALGNASEDLIQLFFDVVTVIDEKNKV